MASVDEYVTCPQCSNPEGLLTCYYKVGSETFFCHECGHRTWDTPDESKRFKGYGVMSVEYVSGWGSSVGFKIGMSLENRLKKLKRVLAKKIRIKKTVRRISITQRVGGKWVPFVAYERKKEPRQSIKHVAKSKRKVENWEPGDIPF